VKRGGREGSCGKYEQTRREGRVGCRRK